MTVRIAASARMTYGEYLASPAWRARRNKRLKLDRRRCQGCGSKTDLHVHHRTYERFGAEKMSDLVTVCSICHLFIHQERERTKRALALVTDDCLARIQRSDSVRPVQRAGPKFVPRYRRPGYRRRKGDWRNASRIPRPERRVDIAHAHELNGGG